MARTTAPLLSFGASGQIAKTQVYSTWRGIPYVRRHVVPANPQTSSQMSTRNTFSFLQSVFKFAGPLFTAPWRAATTGQQLTDRNSFTKHNLPQLRGNLDLTGMLASPGNLGGLPAATVVGSGGAGHLIITATGPAVAPDGWTLTGMTLAAILDQDPETGTEYSEMEFEDDTAPYSNDFNPVAAGTYRIFAWPKWLRPDGKVAYGPSIQSTRVVS